MHAYAPFLIHLREEKFCMHFFWRENLRLLTRVNPHTWLDVYIFVGKFVTFDIPHTWLGV